MALTNSDITDANSVFQLLDNDRVLGVEINGTARAYPLGILWRHEVVNDTLGGENLLLSYCPLTGSGIAFDPAIDGTVRNFGVSGLLFENNLIMFDREMESLWNQMSLGSQCGPDRGKQFKRRPIMETTWGHWKALHPNTTVLTRNTGFTTLPYGVYPYGDYDDLNNSERLLPGSTFSSARPPKELGLGVYDNLDSVVVFPFGSLDSAGSFVAMNETIGSLPFLVTYVRAEQTAFAFDRRVNGQTLTFTVSNAVTREFQDAETGSTWDQSGTAIAGSMTGQTLTPLNNAYVAFWFAWSVYYKTNIRLVQ